MSVDTGTATKGTRPSGECDVTFELGGRRERWMLVGILAATVLSLGALMTIDDLPESEGSIHPLAFAGGTVACFVFGLLPVALVLNMQRLVLGRDRVAGGLVFRGFRLAYEDVADLRFFRGLVHYGTLVDRTGRRRDVRVLPWNGVALAEAFRGLAERTGRPCVGLAEVPRQALSDAVRDATGLEEACRRRAWIRRHLFDFRLEMAVEGGASIQAPLRLYWVAWLPLAGLVWLSLGFVLVFLKHVPGAVDGPRFLETTGFWTTLVVLMCLAAAATYAGVNLATNILFLLVGRNAREREAFAAQLAAARRVQQDLLPRETPSLPGLEISGVCEPAQEVGGDYFDFVGLADGTTFVAVGDVSGKGLPAALLMTLTKGSLRASLRTAAGTLEALAAVNDELKLASSARAFVTLALVRLPRDGHEVEVTRAGHTPPLLVPADGAPRWLCPAGLALGLVAGPPFARLLERQSLALAPGDILVVYSDGVTEAMDPDGNEFGEERLLEAVASARGAPADTIRRNVLEAVTAFRRGSAINDDVTLVVLRRTC